MHYSLVVPNPMKDFEKVGNHFVKEKNVIPFILGCIDI